MPSARDEDPSERERTDRSLAEERGKTDAEMARRARGVEALSDGVVTRARERAEDVLDEARRLADEKLEDANATESAQAAVDEERTREDAILEAARVVAERALVKERDERRRALAALLALERGQTDEHLDLERTRADEVVGSRDEFLALVSHDIRNMIGGLALSASQLLKIPCDPQTSIAVTREGQRIHRYAARMNRLVGDLLDLTSIEAGRLAVVPEREDVTELLRDTVDAFQPSAGAKGISLRTEVKAGAVLARYDHERILQVLANLVGNAVKFTPAGGRIDIAIEAVDGQIQFGVSDTGPGLPADKLAVVFDRYWQSATRRTRGHTAGLGLGLYIARCIVEAHGGRIWATSEPGKGAAFYFTLPGAAPASARS